MKTLPSKKKVAIIGIGCHFSGGIKDPESFWKQLKNCSDGVRDIPSDRWNTDRFYDPDENAPGKMYVKRGAFLEENVYDFDYNFFNFSRREALTLDPQQRLLLKTAYEAMEDAGQDIHLLRKKTVGVFIGTFMLDNFLLRTAKDALKHVNSHTAVAGSATLLSNRISHVFDFTGPSISLDTACSASLVAVHLACQSILSGESELALAGGVNVMLSPSGTILMCKGKFLARDGRSKAFFDHADGYGRGEGAGIVVLKELDRAIADGDPVYAVIEGSAINQDGRTEGISLPNQEAQIAVIRTALKAAGVDASSIGYVEAHGTGTKAGDPIELGALGAVYGEERINPLPVGSVKLNIGHTEAAAGVAGVIKAALMLKYGQILPHMNLGKLSADIPFDELNIRIPLEGEDWYRASSLQFASVNSFGYGGTNGHVILSASGAAAADSDKAPTERSNEYHFLLSARSAASLSMNAAKMLQFLDEKPDVPLEGLAYTLAARRTRHAYNWLVTASDTATLGAVIREKMSETEQTSKPAAAGNGKLVWVFTGMGPQWYGMGQELYKSNKVFKAALDKCDALYQPLAGYSLLEEMQQDETSSRIARNYLAQAANFFIQIGLSEVLNSYGVPKDAVMGHSVGEIAAAVVAGAITLEDGIKIIYHRGRILEEIAGHGTLLAVGLGVNDAMQYIRRFPGLEIATINSPKSVTIAGKKEILEQLEQQLLSADIFAKFVRVEVAYHSSQTNILKEKLLIAFSTVKPYLPALPLYTSITASLVDKAIHAADYWWKNVREQVRFQATIEKLLREQYVNFIEIGPHPVLGGSIKETADKEGMSVNTFFTLKRQNNEPLAINRSMEALISAKVPLALHADLKEEVVSLPPYAWDEEHCWSLGAEMEAFRLGENGQSPFLEERLHGVGTAWKTQLNKPSLAYLKDHQIGKAIVFPAAAYIEAMLSVLSATAGDDVLVLEQLAIERSLSFQPDEYPELFIHLSSNGALSISSQLNDATAEHARASGWTTNKYHSTTLPLVKEILVNAASSHADIYSRFASLGLNYKQYFQTISAYHIAGKRVYARLDSQLQQDGSSILHPALLDGAFQTLILLAAATPGYAYLPVSMESIKVFASLPLQVYCTGEITSQFGNILRGHLQLIDEAGNLLVDIKGLNCKKTLIPDSVNPLQQWVYKYTFAPFSAPWNGELAAAQLIATGSRERFEQLSSALGNVRFIPLKELTVLEKEDFQLLYLPSVEIAINVENILDDSYQLVQLFQGPLMETKPIRFILLLEHALKDETSPDTERINVHHTTFTGFGRTIMTEMPDLQPKLIDLQVPLQPGMLNDLLQHAFPEEELILTSDGWKQGVLIKDDITFPQKTQVPVASNHTGHSKLEVLQKGKMESLQFRNFRPSDPGPQEVQINISASSVNFKDVMKAMGLLNEAALENTYFGSEFGLEGAGIVTKVHETVKDIRRGDRVYFLGSGLRTTINVQEPFVFKLPEHISFHEASTFLVYFTAWTGLVELAQLRKGQRVLIHSAAGGVGLAACKIAKARGAEIFATAGTDDKRELLKQEGIRYIYDSRSLDFYDEILRDTNKEGVDVVLNSLAGPALIRSLELLRTLGTFIELGKQDITNNSKLPLMPFNKSIRFISLDLDKIAPVAPEQIRAFFGNFLEAYTAGYLSPLLYEVYDLPRFREGFKKLATGAHAGKVVIDFADSGTATLPEIQETLRFADNDCVIVSGGCSGFGLRTALWLAERGVKHLVLVSRKGKIAAEDSAIKNRLGVPGCHIYEMALDITDATAVKNAVAYPATLGLHLVGVIHAAAIVEDSIIKNISPDFLNRVFLPKALGALHLHEATKDMQLGFFICYASGVGYIGNPGQAAYAAANTFLVGLVHERKRLGLVATCISWGSIDEVGILSRNEQAKAQLGTIGFTPIAPDKGLEIMEKALDHYQGHVSILDADWDKWTASIAGTHSKVAGLVSKNGKSGQPALLNLLANHLPAEWEQIITNEISQVFASITDIPVASIQSDARLTDLGLDSLMSVELSIALQSKLGLDMAMMEVLGAGTIGKLVQLVKNKVSRLHPTIAISPAKQVKTASAKNLVNDYITRICVGKPYFSLTEVNRSPDGVTAIVEGFYWNRNMALNMADSARHLALLGSCAVADANLDGSRYCYPVQYGDFSMIRIPRPDEKLTLYARSLSFDHVKSRCEALAVIRDSEGKSCIEMRVSYHVIPEKVLYTLFEQHINTDEAWQDIASAVYEEDNPVDPEMNGDGHIHFKIDELQPEQCVGHFANLPAFPVSVMTRYAAHLIEAGRRLTYQDRVFKVERVTCETDSFAFAGESVLFTAYENGNTNNGHSFHWTCEIETPDRKIARLDLYETALTNNKLFKQQHYESI